MAQRLLVAILAVILVVSIQQASSLKCYNCGDGYLCENLFNKSKHKDDLENCVIDECCVKLIQNRKHTRGICVACSDIQCTDTLMYECSCRTDGCNGASPLGYVAIWVAISATIVLALS